MPLNEKYYSLYILNNYGINYKLENIYVNY